MSGTQKDQEAQNMQRIADISTKIREAIRLALPTPLEQFMTVMVPGKVVNYGRLSAMGFSTRLTSCFSRRLQVGEQRRAPSQSSGT